MDYLSSICYAKKSMQKDFTQYLKNSNEKLAYNTISGEILKCAFDGHFTFSVSALRPGREDF